MVGVVVRGPLTVGQIQFRLFVLTTTPPEPTTYTHTIGVGRGHIVMVAESRTSQTVQSTLSVKGEKRGFY